MKRLFLLLGAFSLVACATTSPDRHVSSAYQREQANQQLMQSQAASGVFRGLLKNQSTGATMGAMEIDLQSVQVPVSDGSGVGSVGRAMLQGNVIVVVGDQQAVASITQGAYIPSDDSNNTGELSAFVNVNLGNGASGNTVSFSLNATLNNGTLAGMITPTGGITGITGSFSLTRDASLPKVNPPNQTGSKFYAGTYVNPNCSLPQFKNSLFCKGTNPDAFPVTMTVNMSPSSYGYAFVNLFADIKTCDVQLNFGMVVISMPASEYDSNTRTIRFSGVPMGDSANATLTCRGQGAGYQCSYRSEASGTTYNFGLKPAQGGDALGQVR